MSFFQSQLHPGGGGKLGRDSSMRSRTPTSVCMGTTNKAGRIELYHTILATAKTRSAELGSADWMDDRGDQGPARKLDLAAQADHARHDPPVPPAVRTRTSNNPQIR